MTKKIKIIAIISLFFCGIPLISNSQNIEERTQEEILSTIENKSTNLNFDKINPNNFLNIAEIQIIDKNNAKSKNLEIKIGETLEFGNISIKIHKCWQAPLDQKPDSRILMEIFEQDKDENQKVIFYGWMFASSPSVSDLEHRIYDIKALNCKK